MKIMSINALNSASFNGSKAKVAQKQNNAQPVETQPKEDTFVKSAKVETEEKGEETEEKGESANIHEAIAQKKPGYRHEDFIA